MIPFPVVSGKYQVQAAQWYQVDDQVWLIEDRDDPRCTGRFLSFHTSMPRGVDRVGYHYQGRLYSMPLETWKQRSQPSNFRPDQEYLSLTDPAWQERKAA